MNKVLVIEDHAIVREGLVQILKAQANIHQIDEASTGKEALNLIRNHPYDLIVLDIGLPDIDGLSITKVLKAERPELPILVLTMYLEKQFALRLLKAGVNGYLTKHSASKELVKAINLVLNGERYISSEVAQHLALGLANNSPESPLEALSDREYQVFLLLARSNSVSQIAEQLSLSVKTVSTYRSRILTKLNLSNNLEIMRYALDDKLI